MPSHLWTVTTREALGGARGEVDGGHDGDLRVREAGGQEAVKLVEGPGFLLHHPLLAGEDLFPLPLQFIVFLLSGEDFPGEGPEFAPGLYLFS